MTKRLTTLLTLLHSFIMAQIAPNLSVTDLNGESHEVYEYLDQGKTVILDFFYVNCTHCEDGAPYLDEFWQNYGPFGTDELQVLSLEVGNATNESVIETASSWGINNPVANLNQIPEAYTPFINAYPTYIIICPDKSMLKVVDFVYPETILSWEQSLNTCDFGENFTDLMIFPPEVLHCQNNVNANIIIGNVGSTLINEFTIDVFVDSTYHSSINWNHILPPLSNTNETPYPITFESNEINGEVIEFEIQNNGADANTSNNNAFHDLTDGINTDNSNINIQIQLDNYPTDLIWSLTNSSGEIIIEGNGGNYNPNQLVDIYTTLDINECYTFMVIDIAEDGVCCSFGEGFIQINAGQNNLLFDNSFNNLFVTSFYVGNLNIEEDRIQTSKILKIEYFDILGRKIHSPQPNQLCLKRNYLDDGSFFTEKVISKLN